jgi:hypothetical protein
MMLINKRTYGYSRNKKHITGRGFVDSLSSVFNSLKASVASLGVSPALRNIASYVSTNRDLIAKPVLGAVGSLAAQGLTAAVPALLSHIMSRTSGSASSNTSQAAGSSSGSSRASASRASEITDDPKYKEILQSMIATPPVSNIIGSGVPQVRHLRFDLERRAKACRGAGIKRF